MAASAVTASSTPLLDAAAITPSSQGVPGWLRSASNWTSTSGGADKEENRSTFWGENGDTRAGGRIPNAADGELRKAGEGAAGPRVQALEQRAGPARVRQHLAGRLEALARAFQDGHERVQARRRLGAGQPGPLRPGGEVLLR